MMVKDPFEQDHFPETLSGNPFPKLPKTISSLVANNAGPMAGAGMGVGMLRGVGIPLNEKD